MLPQQAFDRTERPIGRVIGMDVDAKGDPKGYVILLEGEAAEKVLGATRGLLVVPATEATVKTTSPPGETAHLGAENAEAVLVLKSNMERLRRGWAGKAAAVEDEDPSAW